MRKKGLHPLFGSVWILLGYIQAAFAGLGLAALLRPIILYHLQ